MDSGSNKNIGGKPDKNRVLSSLISLLMIALLCGFIWSSLKVEPKVTNEEYYQIIQYFDDGKIVEYELNIANRKLTYILKGEKEKRVYTVPSNELFVSDVHESVREYNKEHTDNPIKMNYEAGTSNYWLIQMLPMFGMSLVLGLMLWWAIKRMSSSVLDDTRRSMAFGKVRLKTGESGKKTTFDDVAGLDEEKEELREIVEFLRAPEKFSDLGARIPKGVLLLGPPGTGKTLLARAVAGEANATFLTISGSDFVEMYVGVGASRVRDLFDTAKKNIPSIIFIDEIDAVGRHRGAGMGGGHDEREQTLNQLLVEMDGFGENTGVIIIAATNRPDILDPALLRPGRFDRQVTVHYPDVLGRELILKVHARNKPIGPDVDLSEIARATSGFTGADLENLLNEAALLAARRSKRAITKLEIEEATIKVIVGTEKKSKKVTDDEKKLTAYHEAGHAVTNFYLDSIDPVHQISIIPRGMSGGYTMSLPKEDKSSYISKRQMLDQLVTLLGGRVAEAVVLGDISTGASNDIERATNIARAMITKYGMSDKLGPISYSSENNEVFIGRDYGQVRNFSDETASVIDREIEKLITDAYDRADEILRLHIDKLHLLAEFLMRYEKIDGDVFIELMEDENFDIDAHVPYSKKVDGKLEVIKEVQELAVVEEQVTALVLDEKSEIKEETELESDLESEEVKSEPEEETELESELESEEVKSEPEEETELESELESEEVKPELEGETVETEATEEPAETTETALDSEDKDVLEDLIPGLEEINASFDKKPEEVIPLEPTVATEGTEVILTEAELQLKREIDRESGLISAEDEYADVNLDPSKIDEANINDYLEDEEKDSDKSLETVEPEVEGLSGEALPVLDEDKDETEADAMLPTAEEIDAFNAESMDIGGFINKMDPGYSEEEQAAIDRALGIGKKHTKKAKVKAEKPKKPDPVDEHKIEEDLDEELKEEVGTYTENDEIYALYELLKATREFDSEEEEEKEEEK